MLKKSLQFGLILLNACVFNLALAAENKSPATTAKMMADAQALISLGKYADSYALMEPYEFDQAGDVLFDYLFGISAVSAGQAGRATTALERVEVLYPEYGDVRLYLGIAYYQMGDSARAKQAFTALLAQKNLIPPSKSSANQYLAAIQQQETAKQQQAEEAWQAFWMGNVEMGMGHDSNITTAASNTGNGQPASTGLAGNFSQLNANVELRKPLFGAGSYGFVMLDSSNRAYFGHSNMNPYTNTLKTGLNWAQGVHTYRLDVSHRDYRQKGIVLGSNNNSAQNGVSADARFGLNANDFLALNAQYNTPRFAAAASVPQDTNQFLLGTNYMHIFPVTGSPVLYFAFTQARDKSLHDIAAVAGAPVAAGITSNYNRITNTFIAYSQYTFVPSADVTAMWMSSRRNDRSAYARSATEALPKDEMLVTMLGINWRPANKWIVKTQYMSLQNKSVVAGYAFKKNEFSVNVKREFN